MSVRYNKQEVKPSQEYNLETLFQSDFDSQIKDLAAVNYFKSFQDFLNDDQQRRCFSSLFEDNK